MRFKQRILAVIAALGLIVLGALPASVSTPKKVSPVNPLSSSLTLGGGLRVVPVRANQHSSHAELTSSIRPMAPAGWVNGGKVVIENFYQDAYAVSVQPNNTGGRKANHLYMWANENADTQIFTLWVKNPGASRIYVFQSEYNGLCINVPGASEDSGVQLIVYNCENFPTDEQWKATTLVPTGRQAFVVNYGRIAMSMAIGSNFFDGNNPTGGNGAWVILYPYAGSTKMSWILGPA